jgi:hypothetical protein
VSRAAAGYRRTELSSRLTQWLTFCGTTGACIRSADRTSSTSCRSEQVRYLACTSLGRWHAAAPARCCAVGRVGKQGRMTKPVSRFGYRPAVALSNRPNQVTD